MEETLIPLSFLGGNLVAFQNTSQISFQVWWIPTYISNIHSNHPMSAGYVLFSVVTICRVSNRWKAELLTSMTKPFCFYLTFTPTIKKKKAHTYLLTFFYLNKTKMIEAMSLWLLVSLLPHDVSWLVNHMQAEYESLMGPFNYSKHLLFLSLFWGHPPSESQGLLLAQHSGITHSGAQGTLWDVGDQTLVGCITRQASCAISLVPSLHSFATEIIS